MCGTGWAGRSHGGALKGLSGLMPGTQGGASDVPPASPPAEAMAAEPGSGISGAGASESGTELIGSGA